MPRAKKAAVTPTPQEQFATLVETYKNLPATDPNGFKGKSPNEPASNYQKGILDKMGIGYSETSTKLDAHASMKAFADLNPEKNAEIWAEQKAAVEAKKAESSKSAEKSENGVAKYTVNKADVEKPATFHQIVQLNAAGIRKYADTSPIPTRGEVADKMNALQASDPAKYSEAMSKANDTVAKWKHQAPSKAQAEFAESVGIKVTPFTPANGNIAQKGSTAFSVGEKIHNVKVTEPEKYAEAKAASDAKYAKPEDAKPDLTKGLEEKAKAAVNAKIASETAKTGTVPSFTIPTAPSPQVEGPQAGE